MKINEVTALEYNDGNKYRVDPKFAKQSTMIRNKIMQRIRNAKEDPLDDIDFNQLDQLGTYFGMVGTQSDLKTPKDIINKMNDYTQERNQGSFDAKRMKELFALL